ncbi:MAG: type IV conjugative transfer system lipoprotein TraV [Sutterella sp.]
MNKFLKVTAFASAVAALGGLTGCSALNVGEEHFACDGMPGSVYCHSARDVYEKTNDGVVPSPVSKAEGAYNEECTDCIRAEDVNPDLKVEEDDQTQYAITSDGRRLRVVDGRVARTANGRTVVIQDDGDEVINNYVAPALPDNPVPIRTPSQVMRLWVAPYVDVTGDLIAPGFVYTEIEPRRWIYPEDEAQHNPKMYNPLKGPNANGRGGAANRILPAGNTYSSPKSYSNPQDDNRQYSNSLLKFRKERAEKFKAMRPD